MRLLIASILIALTTACAMGTDFHPKTIEGANCKQQCASDMAKCRASSYTCDKAAATCMNSCQEIDALTKK